MNKELAKKIAEESESFCDLVRSCVVHCGWQYDPKNALWIASNNHFYVTEFALREASLSGLGYVGWVMNKVEQEDTYKFIMLAWGYASTKVQVESLKWSNDVIYA